MGPPRRRLALDDRGCWNEAVRRLFPASIPLVLVALVACSSVNAPGYRKATATERKEFVALLRLTFHPGDNSEVLTSARVLRPNPAWASIGCRSCGWPDSKTLLVHRQHGSWSLVYDFTLRQAKSKSCEVAPSQILKDLYDISCPRIPSERKALAVALNSVSDYPTVMGSAAFSRVDRSWASVQDIGSNPHYFQLIHRIHGSWGVAYLFDVVKGNVDEIATRSAYGGCAYAPAKVIQDLYGLTCPAWRGLHAREATTNETASMKAAFVPTLGKSLPADPQRYVHLSACVSRLDPGWAKAGVVYGDPEKGEMNSDAGPTLYFHRQGASWRIAGRPSHAIALSFTICDWSRPA